MTRSALLASVAIFSSLTTAAAAQDIFDLGEIIVSAGLSPIEAARYGGAASVVTAQDIENRGITNVQDALRALPGVSINGSSTSFTQVRIRGGEANHTLILIDGVAAAGGDGEYILSGLETANIERIEVLRGPQSVFYGSNASAGVINIITKKGEDGTTARGTLQVGDATIATAFIAQRSARGGISLSLSRTDDKGYDQSGDGGEKDELERDSAILSGDYLVTDDLKLGFTLRRSEERYEFDDTPFGSTDAKSYVVDDPTQFSDRDEQTFAAFAEYSMFTDRMMHRVAYEKTLNEQSFGSEAPTETTTEAVKYRLSYGLDGTVTQADQLINLLLENERDTSSSNPLFDREATSVALEYRGSFANGLNLQAGVRFDDNEVFDDDKTWNIGQYYTLAGSGIRFHGSAGTGVVNPSYFELYADDFGFTGNPNLSPERNLSFDIGVEFPVFAGRGTVDVTYFNETLTDEIASVSTGPGTFTLENQSGDSDRQGVEVSGEVQATDALGLRLAYTYIDATNPDGSVEIRRPKHELILGATLETFGGRGSVSGDLRHVAGNFDTQFWTGGTTRELPDFTTVDVAARYDLTDSVALTGRVTNLFDDDATEVWGFATRGRAAYVGIDARF